MLSGLGKSLFAGARNPFADGAHVARDRRGEVGRRHGCYRSRRASSSRALAACSPLPSSRR